MVIGCRLREHPVIASAGGVGARFAGSVATSQCLQGNLGLECGIKLLDLVISILHRLR
jgi:hypothetical protein